MLKVALKDKTALKKPLLVKVAFKSCDFTEQQAIIKTRQTK